MKVWTESDYVQHFCSSQNQIQDDVLVGITLTWQTSTSAAIRELTSTEGSPFEEKAGVIQHKLYYWTELDYMKTSADRLNKTSVLQKCKSSRGRRLHNDRWTL